MQAGPHTGSDHPVCVCVLVYVREAVRTQARSQLEVTAVGDRYPMVSSVCTLQPLFEGQRALDVGGTLSGPNSEDWKFAFRILTK